jgi:hypothetical protein
MKKTLIALATLAATGAAFAQSTATISGTISAGIMDSGAAGDTAQVVSLGGGANAINIVTAEDLGGGMRAGFTGQIRFSAASGDRTSGGNGNALFHDANVYLTNSMGTVRLGKIAEMNTCAFDPWGCAGGAAMMAGVGVGGDGRGLIGARTIQNAISFATPVINGFSATYQTSLSANPGVHNTATAGSQIIGRTNERTVLSLNYAKGPLSAQVLRTEGDRNDTTDRPSVGMVNAINQIADTNGASAQGISASYNFGVARLNVSNIVTKTATATTNDINTISASIPRGAMTFLVGYSKDKGSLATATTDTKIAAGVNYALSKRTTIGADVFKAEATGITTGTIGGTPAALTSTTTPGNAGTGFVLRARHTF